MKINFELDEKVAPCDRLLTRREAAEYLGVAVKTLASWTSSGRYDLEIIKIGARLIRYKKSDLDAMVLKHRCKKNGTGVGNEKSY